MKGLSFRYFPIFASFFYKPASKNVVDWVTAGWIGQAIFTRIDGLDCGVMHIFSCE